MRVEREIAIKHGFYIAFEILLNIYANDSADCLPVLMNILEQDGTDYMKLIGSKIGE